MPLVLIYLSKSGIYSAIYKKRNCCELQKEVYSFLNSLSMKRERGGEGEDKN